MAVVRYRYIPDVPEEVIREGVRIGLFREVEVKGRGNVAEFTEAGLAWFREWCDEQLKIARCMAL